MSKLFKLMTVVLVLGIAAWAYAEFTESDYATLVSVKKRIEAVRDAQIVINKTLAAVESNAAELEGYLTIIGSADTLISKDLIDEITRIKNTLKNGAANIRSSHPVFLTGSSGE